MESHFNGQVQAVDGPSGNPSGFVLATRARVLTMEIAPDATFIAHSAQADVQGFAAGDYALVDAHRAHRAWVADRIVFDVHPVRRVATISLTVQYVRLAPNGKALVVRLASGMLRRVLLQPSTVYRMDGETVGALPTFTRGTALQLVVRPTDQGWVAVEIDASDTTSRG